MMTTDTIEWTAAKVAAIAERLEQNTYTNLFDCLEDWHLLQAAAYQVPEWVEPYTYLLEREVDED